MILARSYGEVQSGKLILSSRQWFSECISKSQDCQVEITVTKFLSGITHQQRKYFYGVVVDILYEFFKQSGDEYDKADIVDFLKDRFMYREKMCKISRMYLKVPISLGNNDRGMTMEEFQEKKEAIQRWAIERLGIDIPEPDPNWRVYKKSGGKSSL